MFAGFKILSKSCKNMHGHIQTIKMVPGVLENEMLNHVQDQDQKDGTTYGPFLKWSQHSVMLLATPQSGGASITKHWTDLYLTVARGTSAELCIRIFNLQTHSLNLREWGANKYKAAGEKGCQVYRYPENPKKSLCNVGVQGSPPYVCRPSAVGVHAVLCATVAQDLRLSAHFHCLLGNGVCQ